MSAKKIRKGIKKSTAIADQEATEIENEIVINAPPPFFSSKEEVALTASTSGHRTVSINSLTRTKSRSKSKARFLERKPSEIPTEGSLLLDWVRRRSYPSEEDLKSTDEKEYTETAKDKKKKNYPQEKKIEKGVHTKVEKQKKRKQKAKEELEEKILLPRPEGLDDMVTLLIKERREAKRIAEEQSRLLAESSDPSTHIPTPKSRKGRRKGKLKSKIQPKENLKLEKEKGAMEAEIPKNLEEDEKEELQKQQKVSEKEQLNRIDGLKSTLEVIKSIDDHSRRIQRKKRKEDYWRLYVECGSLPIVNHVANMTTYLHSWGNVMVDTTPEEASSRTRDALKLLNVLDDFIDNKFSPELLENFKWLRASFRSQLREMMEYMTFKLLRDVNQNMNHINLYTGDFNYKDDNFTLCLWLKFEMPTPLFNPRKPAPPPISLTIKDLNLSLEFPSSVTGEGMVVRIMYLNYDHLSDTSKGFLKPAKPEYYDFNLKTVMEKEWKIMKKYRVIGRYRAQYEKELQKHQDHLQEKANYKRMSQAPPTQDLPPLSKFQLPEIDLEGEIPDVPATKLDPTPEEYAETLEDIEYQEMRKHLLYVPRQDEINLRKYIILGGLHILNLFYRPPQPQHLVTINLSISTFVLPKCLTEVPFYEEFKTLPPSGEQKSPEELEAALKLQEEGFAKLLSITITLPTHVMYLEPPVVCMWMEEKDIWSSEDIQDVKHNEEKGTVSFRAGRLGIFGLATFRYGNLPYQTWDIKPDEDNNIIFQLTAAILMFEFKIKDSTVTVMQFQNGPNNALQHIVSKTFSINKLSRILREGGVDIFPDYDAFCYVEGSCEKHWATEYMCYYNMAQLSICYNFAWSRWNATEGYRSIVMQMRVFNPEQHTQRSQNLVLVTPSRAAFINCAEVTPVFCRDPVEGSKFSCNLWYLMKATSTIYVRNKISEISPETVHTVARMLIGTRILSFS